MHVANNNFDGTLYMSNSGKLSSRNFTAIDFPNVSSEAQASIVNYLLTQIDLADRAKKKICRLSQCTGASNRCNERSVKCKEMSQQYNAEWKGRARSLPEFRYYEQQHNRVDMQIARKNPVYRDIERECSKKRMKMARTQRTGILRKKKEKENG